MFVENVSTKKTVALFNSSTRWGLFINITGGQGRIGATVAVAAMEKWNDRWILHRDIKETIIKKDTAGKSKRNYKTDNETKPVVMVDMAAPVGMAVSEVMVAKEDI